MRPGFAFGIAALVALARWAGGENLVLVGGGLADEAADIWDAVVRLAGGVGAAKIGVFTTSSADPEDSAIYYQEMFESYGVLSVAWIPVTETSNNADDDVVVELVRRQTGFFFGGGDQLRIITALVHEDGSDTKVLEALREMAAEGVVIGGTSAGTTCQSEGPMVQDGISYNALAYGSYTGEFDGSDDLWVRPSGGLALAPRLTLDTHFAERQREMRLVRMMLDFDDFDRWGVGVDENTALVVQGDVGEVVGENGVYFLDLSSVVFSSDPAADISGLRLTYLTHGDKFHFGSAGGSGVVEIASWKDNLAGNEFYDDSYSSDDIFGGKPNTPAGEFRYTATTLFDSRQSDSSSLSSERNPEFRVDMVKDASSVGYGGYMGDRFLISFVDLLVDVYVNSLE